MTTVLRWQNASGGNTNTSNEKIDIMHSKNCKLLSKIKGNSVNYCDFLKFIIYLRGVRCDFSPRTPKKLAKPLLRYVVQRSTLSHYMGGPKIQRTLITGLATRRLWTGWVILRLSVYSRNTDTPFIM